MVEITKKIFGKFAYFHFLSHETPDTQVLRLQLRKGKTLSNHEQKLLAEFLKGAMNLTCEIRLQNILLAQGTIMFVFKNFSEDKLNQLKTPLKGKIKKEVMIMNAILNPIWAKIERIQYWARSNRNVQIIKIWINKGEQLSTEEKGAILDHVRSLLPTTAEVSEFKPEEPEMTVYVQIADDKNSETFYDLIKGFSKTP